jgi:hypothetical protein
MASLSGTFTAVQQTTAPLLYLRATETVRTTLTISGSARVSLCRSVGPSQAVVPIETYSASGTYDWVNTTGEDYHLLLLCVSVAGSAAYTFADVAGDQILQEWRAADGTLVARITDEGFVGGEDGLSLNVLALGADPSGVRDSTAAFQEASATGAQHVLVPSGTFLLDGQVTVPAGQVWSMAGATLTTTRTTGVMFECNQVDDWALLGPFIIEGPGLAVGTFRGIRVTDGHRWRVAYPTFKSLAGSGLFVQNSAGAGTYRGDRGQVVAPTAIECDTGVYFNSGGGAEYNTVVAPNLTGCNVGFYVVAGNIACVGGSIVDNVIGVQMTGGANHGHGIFSGTQINHNTDHNVQATDVTNGYTFDGCHLYDGSGLIELVNSANIVFKDCYLTGTITNTPGADSSYNYIVDCHGPGTAIDITASGSDELIVIGLRGPGSYDNNVSQSDPSSVYVELVSGAGVTQSLTSGVAATLTWGQETFDRRAAFSAGVFTVPADQYGTYRISGNLVFSGTSMTAADSFVVLRVDGTSRALFSCSAVSTTQLVCLVDYTRYLAPTDTVDLRATIVGTTPVFGDATFESTLTIMRVDA